MTARGPVQKKVKAGGILKRRGLVLLGVMSAPDHPGIASAIFEALGEAQLNAEFIVQCIDLNNDAHVLFCVVEENAEKASALLQPIARELRAKKITATHHVAAVSVFGPDFRELPGIAGLAFGALARAGINILAVSTSISTITCVIAEEQFDRALEALQGVFALP
ncbi:MAG: ACT domain-containing protein [Chloroflexi bacterium]|nr:ACT domain-containing protein [Chloroflexota bacterium]